MKLLRCNIDEILCTYVEVHRYVSQGTPSISAKVGLSAGKKPVAEVNITNVDEISEKVNNAAAALLEAIEEAYGPQIGTLVSKQQPGEEPPTGIVI